MKIEKMTYSKSAVEKGIQMLKDLRTATPKKADHNTVCFNLRNVYQYCFENINPCAFNLEFSPMWDYGNAVFVNYQTENADYDGMKYSKKHLDQMKKRALEWIKRELTEIAKMIEKGEVEVII